jgi:hypothetical protein
MLSGRASRTSAAVECRECMQWSSSSAAAPTKGHDTRGDNIINFKCDNKHLFPIYSYQRAGSFRFVERSFSLNATIINRSTRVPMTCLVSHEETFFRVVIETVIQWRGLLLPICRFAFFSFTTQSDRQ